LPSGTPDVVTPLATVLYDTCAPFGAGVGIGAVQVCATYQFGPPAGEVLVAGAQPSVGVLLPRGAFSGSAPNCGVIVLEGASGVALYPPGGPC
jgi:hypothetical protein